MYLTLPVLFLANSLCFSYRRIRNKELSDMHIRIYTHITFSLFRDSTVFYIYIYSKIERIQVKIKYQT